jgi:hypothetical protein
MMKKRFSVEQIVGVLKQAEVGVPVVEVIRKAGISEQTFYRWKAKYVGLEVDQVRSDSQRNKRIDLACARDSCQIGLCNLLHTPQVCCGNVF